MASSTTVTANQRISDIQNEPCKMLLPIEGYEDSPLLPLNICVEPLEKLIPNITRNSWIAKERTDENPPDDLTQEESAAIQLYTMEWQSNMHSLYFHLNSALRAEDRRLLVPYFGYLKLILSALWKLQSVRKTVWCGIKADLSSQYIVGKTFVWWGFSSCTESLTLLESEKFLGNTGTRTLFNIECESGKEIQHHSYFQQENEILLLPATQFEVRGKINPEPGLHIIHLKEIKPLFSLLQPPFSHSMNSTKSIPTDTYHKTIDNTSFNANVSHIIATKSSEFMKTKLQQPMLKSSVTYHNKMLEDLIQRQIKSEFFQVREKKLNDEDAHLIADELGRNTHWKMLSLEDNSIGVAGAASLSTALQINSILEKLRLGNNQFGDDGATCIAAALKLNKTLNLKMLYLNENKIADAGALQLASMLQHNESLGHIDIADNEIGDTGMAALATALKSNTILKHLDLSRNKVTDQSVPVIKDLLQHTKTLDFLFLNTNLFTCDAKSTLNYVAKHSSACVHLL